MKGLTAVVMLMGLTMASLIAKMVLSQIEDEIYAGCGDDDDLSPREGGGRG
jgi:hypothetical protein